MPENVTAEEARLLQPSGTRAATPALPRKDGETNQAYFERRKRVNQQAVAAAPEVQKEEVSPKEYAERLARAQRRDNSLVSADKERRTALALQGWKNTVGATFAEAHTERPDVLERVNRLVTGAGRHQTSLVFYGNYGTGKAQPISEPVLTPSGFVAMGSLNVGDEVVGSDGFPTKVVDVYPQGSRPIYKVSFSDGASTLCDEEHLWTVSVRKFQKGPKKGQVDWRVLTTKEILNRGVVNTVGRNQWSVPVVKPVAYEEKQFAIAPYLLGALLGDGYLDRQGIMISSADEEILDKVRKELPEELELRLYSPKTSTYDWAARFKPGVRQYRNPLRAELEELGLWGTRSSTKFIPAKYLLGSIEQRLELLRGLMDTDGETSERQGGAVFSTASQQLSADVEALVRSLGGTLSTRIRTGIKGSNHPSYRTTVNLGDLNPFSLKRKADKWKPRSKYLPSRRITSIEYSHIEEAQCIRVAAADSLYVTKDYVVTHNTWQAYAYIAEAMKRGALTPGQIIAGTETSIIGDIAAGGWQRPEKIRQLQEPRNQLYFIDEVGQGYFSREEARTEAWFGLIDHIYSRQLTLLITTNLKPDANVLGNWLGVRTYDRLMSLLGGRNGFVTLGNVNRRPDVAERNEQMYRSQVAGPGANRHSSP